VETNFNEIKFNSGCNSTTEAISIWKYNHVSKL
jgi:hypothetical protein